MPLLRWTMRISKCGTGIFCPNRFLKASALSGKMIVYKDSPGQEVTEARAAAAAMKKERFLAKGA